MSRDKINVKPLKGCIPMNLFDLYPNENEIFWENMKFLFVFLKVKCILLHAFI